jgi:hypothetical protein
MRKGTGTAILLLPLIGLLWACPSLQAADEGPLSVRGTRHLGVNFGYGYSFSSNKDIRFAPVSPYFGYVFTDPVGTGWYRGTGECIVEGDFNYVYKGQKRHATGFTLLGRYNLLSKHESWRPYVQAGFGMIGTNLSMRGFGSDFNFTSNIGAGMQYFWNACNAVNFEWRFKHISNADIDKDNDGLNMSILMLGYSHTF